MVANIHVIKVNYKIEEQADGTPARRLLLRRRDCGRNRQPNFLSSVVVVVYSAEDTSFRGHGGDMTHHIQVPLPEPDLRDLRGKTLQFLRGGRTTRPNAGTFNNLYELIRDFATQAGMLLGGVDGNVDDGNDDIRGTRRRLGPVEPRDTQSPEEVEQNFKELMETQDSGFSQRRLPGPRLKRRRESTWPSRGANTCVPA
jgi:hypothetical protein